MAALWALQVRTRDASHVDVGWAYLLGFLAVLYAALGGGSPAQRVLIAVLAGIWSLRLGTYLLVNRVLGKEEDGRYRELRRRWGPAANRRFFVFFQAQALLDVVFSLPFLLGSGRSSGRARRSGSSASSARRPPTGSSRPGAPTLHTGASPAGPGSGAPRGTRTTSSNG